MPDWVKVVCVAALGLPFGSCGDSAALRATLPVTGDAPGDVRYRLEPSAPDPDEDVAVSWCLKLRYTGDITLDGDPLTAGAETCGPSPAPRVSGMLTYDCAKKLVLVFGGARSKTGGVELLGRKRQRLPVEHADLPPRSGFAGSSFVAAFAFRDLPATLHEASGDQREVTRFPPRSEVCGPEGGQPFASFPEPGTR